MQLPQRLARFDRPITNPVQRLLGGVGAGDGRVFPKLPFENALLLGRGDEAR